MIEMKQILCPIDFSEQSRHAFDHAAALARWYGSTITVLYVHPFVPVAAAGPGAPVFPPLVVTAADFDDVIRSMQAFAEGEGAAGLQVRFEIGQGAAVPEILAHREALPADLIVMGTHGRSGFERLVLGSVAEKVLRKAGCPVLTVPPRAPDAVPVSLFKNILCAVDFSDCSRKALDYAMSLAQEADAKLTVLHVVELPSDHQQYRVGGSDVLMQYASAVEADRATQLRTIVPDAVRAYCTVETELARGKPYREILRVAAARKHDLIVIGIHGRGPVDRAFFGSTTQHVVRDATCPVLTLRVR